MAYASVNGLELYYERHGAGRPLVLLHGGLMTIDLNFGDLLVPLAARYDVIAVELHGHGHTADADRPMTIEGSAADVVALLDDLGVDRADVYGYSLGGLVACAMAVAFPERVRRVALAAADPHRPPGREAPEITEDRLPTQADFQAMRDAYGAVAPDPSHFDAFAERASAMVHGFAGWTDELRSLRVPTLLIYGDRDFTPLPHIVELFELLPDAQLAILAGTTHMGITQRSAEVLPLLARFFDAD
jgi:pimeloyl-ACP methyl ester carboxylesterase